MADGVPGVTVADVAGVLVPRIARLFAPMTAVRAPARDGTPPDGSADRS